VADAAVVQNGIGSELEKDAPRVVEHLRPSACLPSTTARPLPHEYSRAGIAQRIGIARALRGRIMRGGLAGLGASTVSSRRKSVKSASRPEARSRPTMWRFIAHDNRGGSSTSPRPHTS